MAERKAVNKYYPPDWDPAKGSVNKHVGQHPLRERAKKLSQGILVIRFEMPYNIWCGGCGNHIGMGVRYNAEKKKVGNYYTTPIYRFRMKCHLCDNYIEIETDPKNCDYTIVAGARRKEERWDPAATENVIATDHAEKQKLIDDAMFKLEHGEKDKRKSKAAIPALVQIKDMQTQWKDDFALNQMLRKKFRQEKKVILQKEEKDQEIKDKGGLDLDLVNENPDDIALAKNVRFRSAYEEDKRKRRLQIKSRPMFSNTSDKNSQRASLLEKRQKMMLPKPGASALTTVFTRNIEDFGITRNATVDLKEKECSVKVAQGTCDLTTTAAENATNKCVSRTNLQSTSNRNNCTMKEYAVQRQHDDKEMKKTLEHTENVVTSTLNEGDKLTECSNQLSEETFIRDKPQTVPATASNHQRQREDKRNNTPAQTIKTSCSVNNANILLEQNISLVSEMYSDTDSDSSK